MINWGVIPVVTENLHQLMTCLKLLVLPLNQDWFNQVIHRYRRWCSSWSGGTNTMRIRTVK